MSELDRFDKLANEATTKAALAVGREAAKRAADKVLSVGDAVTGEGGDKPKSKARRWKLIALALLGVFVVIGVVGLLLSYWYWFLAAGVVGLAGFIGYLRLKSRFAKPSLPADAHAEKALADAHENVAPRSERAATPALRVEAPPSEPVDPEGDARRAELKARRAKLEARKAEMEQRARLAEAEALREQEVDAELAAMKKRLKESGE